MTDVMNWKPQGRERLGPHHDPRKAWMPKDPKHSGIEELADRNYRRFCDKHYRLIEHIDHVGLPKPGEQWRIVTKRSFNSVQFLDYVAQKEGIEFAFLAVYSINYEAARCIIGLLDARKIAQAEILMSNLRNFAHRKKEAIVVGLFRDHPRLRLWMCASHAKIITCRSRAGNYYTFEGSGNMAANSRVEQYVVDNDRGVFDFTLAWTREVRDLLKKRGLTELVE